MFLIAAGYDVNETDKKIKDPKYKRYMKSMGDVLPCRYCRESYEKFYDSMDIQRYLDMPACGLIRFVYDMKNLVNAKLVAQENKQLDEEYAKLIETKSPNDPAVAEAMKVAKARICYTKPAPPFENVVAELMLHRAGCSAVTKTCRAPLKTGNSSSSFPTPPVMPVLPVNAYTDGILYRKDPSVAAGGRRSRSRSRSNTSRSRSRSGRRRRSRTRSYQRRRYR